MAFDLGQVMARKQERECARLDAFEFHHKARTVRLVAEWVRGRAGASNDIDPVAFATRVALAPLDAVIRDLRALCTAGVTDEDWQRQVERLTGVAYRDLVSEFGDPAPHRMA
jgi:hypothetical protein